jgi:hypothetical protein
VAHGNVCNCEWGEVNLSRGTVNVAHGNVCDSEWGEVNLCYEAQ